MRQYCSQKMKKGISLYLTLMILSLLLGISLGLSALLFGQLKIIRGIEESVIAFYAADTGIEKTLYEFQCSYSHIVLPNGSFFDVTVKCNPAYTLCPGCGSDGECDAPRFCFKSNGTFGETTRAIRVEY